PRRRRTGVSRRETGCRDGSGRRALPSRRHPPPHGRANDRRAAAVAAMLPVMAGPLLITSESFEQLEDEWASLVAAIPDSTPFSHPAFVAAWLRHFTPAQPPIFLGIRDEERLVGVATLEPGPRVARQLGD